MSNLKRQSSYFLTNVYGGGLFWLLPCLLPTQHGDRSQPTLVQQEVLPEGCGGDMQGACSSRVHSSLVCRCGVMARGLGPSSQPDGNQQNHVLSPPYNLEGSPDTTQGKLVYPPTHPFSPPPFIVTPGPQHPVQ